VPVFSFTFGIPPGIGDLDAFVVGTATTVEEAVALERAGVQAVVAQGYEAGGHRGTFLGPVDHSLIGTLALVPQVADAVGVPVVASGGIMDGRRVAAALVLGAQGVQLGTAFLRSDEAGTSDEHRRALAADTTVTAVLTGRHARAVRTPVVEELEQSGIAPPDYPLPRFFLRDPPMLAGQGGALARSLAAGPLADETTNAIIPRSARWLFFASARPATADSYQRATIAVTPADMFPVYHSDHEFVDCSGRNNGPCAKEPARTERSRQPGTRSRGASPAYARSGLPVARKVQQR
jgi:hypothetical protein